MATTQKEIRDALGLSMSGRVEYDGDRRDAGSEGAMPDWTHAKQLDAGILIERHARPGVSGVFRITVHDAASIKREHDDAVLETSRAIDCWIALYGETIAGNEFEPFDQPSAAAYMPHARRAFDVESMAGGTTLMIERWPRSAALRRRIRQAGASFLQAAMTDKGSLEEAILGFVADVDLPEELRERCVARIRAACERVMASWQPPRSAAS